MDLEVKKLVLIEEHNKTVNNINSAESAVKEMKEHAAELRGQVKLIDEMLTDRKGEENLEG